MKKEVKLPLGEHLHSDQAIEWECFNGFLNYVEGPLVDKKEQGILISKVKKYFNE